MTTSNIRQTFTNKYWQTFTKGKLSQTDDHFPHRHDKHVQNVQLPLHSHRHFFSLPNMTKKESSHRQANIYKRCPFHPYKYDKHDNQFTQLYPISAPASFSHTDKYKYNKHLTNVSFIHTSRHTFDKHWPIPSLQNPHKSVVLKKLWVLPNLIRCWFFLKKIMGLSQSNSFSLRLW